MRCLGTQSHLVRKVELEPGAQELPGKVASGMNGEDDTGGWDWGLGLDGGSDLGGLKPEANLSVGPRWAR